MTRRTFFNLLAKLAAVLGLQRLVSACGGSPSGPAQDGPHQGSVTAAIDGPIAVDLPEDGDPSATFDSLSRAYAGIASERWERRRISPTAEAEHVYVGEGRQIEVSFPRDDAPAVYELKLTVEAEDGASDEARRPTAVLRPLPPSSPYQVPIAFIRYDLYDRTSPPALCFMSPENPSDVVRVVEGEFVGGLSWEPNGERLCVGQESYCDLYTYHVTSQTFTQIVATERISWGPAWSPQGEWIAYLDDTRFNGQLDEPCLVRPDGSETIWLSGDTPMEEFVGFYPSWNPEGTKLALGNTRWTVGTTDLRRLAIYSDLWSWRPKRDLLHSDDEIRRVLHTADVQEGVNGVAWSPYGNLIAYNVWVRGTNEFWMAIASADGYGILGLLDRPGALLPCWSPDGRYLFYTAYVGDPAGGRIFRVNADGTGEIDLSSLSDPEGSYSDASPTWYG